jgi:hypothetical protein
MVDSQFDASNIVLPTKRASIYMSPPALSRISSPSKAYDDVKKLLLEALRVSKILAKKRLNRFMASPKSFALIRKSR